MDKTQKSISKDKSKIAEAVLKKDRQVVQKVYPKMVEKYGERLSEKDIQVSLLWHWKSKRTGKDALDAEKSLEGNSFEKLMLAQGVLRIKSTPSRANVFIDGQAFPRTTDTIVLIGLGRHTVKAQKGDAEAEEACVVKDDEISEVKLRLKKRE